MVSPIMIKGKREVAGVVAKQVVLNGWRVAGWGSLLALFLLPPLFMRLAGKGGWSVHDFVFAAILLLSVGVAVELAAHRARPGARRFGYMLAAITAFLTCWSNGAVGIIGDDNSVNRFFSSLCSPRLSLAPR